MFILIYFQPFIKKKINKMFLKLNKIIIYEKIKIYKINFYIIIFINL